MDKSWLSAALLMVAEQSNPENYIELDSFPNDVPQYTEPSYTGRCHNNIQALGSVDKRKKKRKMQKRSRKRNR